MCVCVCVCGGGGGLIGVIGINMYAREARACSVFYIKACLV